MARWLIAAALIGLPVAANAAEAQRRDFGQTSDGRKVEAITLSNGNGVRATILTYGAILQAVEIPDRAGKVADIALGYNDMTGYIEAPNYFGATAGRYANRIRGGTFKVNGKTYKLALNNGPNALHGGVKGFDKQMWTIDSVTGGDTARVVLRYVSADGEEGYPGKLAVTATYSLNEANELSVVYEATTSKSTIVNITNHSYFNLAGEGSGRSIYDAMLTIPADATTPVDATLIPNGQLRPVEGTPFDFRKPTRIGSRIRDARDEQIRFGKGYDENFVVQRGVSPKPVLHARVEDSESGRIMDVWSNQPGVQLYTGNFLDGSAVGKSGMAYRQGDGIALEPQVFPDTPNQPAFGSAQLNPGETYRNVIIYRFSTTAP